MERIVIDREDIEDFLYLELINEGLVPEDDEIQILTDIVFDLIIMLLVPDILEDEGEDD